MTLKKLWFAAVIWLSVGCSQPEEVSEKVSLSVSDCLKMDLYCIESNEDSFIDIEKSTFDWLIWLDVSIIRELNERKELIKYLIDFDDYINVIYNTKIFKALYYATNLFVDGHDNYYPAINTINKAIWDTKHVNSFTDNSKKEIISRLKYMKI